VRILHSKVKKRSTDRRAPALLKDYPRKNRGRRWGWEGPSRQNALRQSTASTGVYFAGKDVRLGETDMGEEPDGERKGELQTSRFDYPRAKLGSKSRGDLGRARTLHYRIVTKELLFVPKERSTAEMRPFASKKKGKRGETRPGGGGAGLGTSARHHINPR